MKLSARFIRLQMQIQLKLQALSFVTLVVMLIQPVVYSGIALILGNVYSDNPLQVVISVVGGGLLGIWGNVLFISAFDITSDRWNGVLEQIVGSPMDISQILRVRCLTNVLLGCVSLGLSVLIAAIFFKFRLNTGQALWLLVSVVVALIGFWSMGILLANLNAATRKSKLLITTIESPIIVLSGFMFPIDLLPEWMQWIAAVIPVRWAGSLIQASLSAEAADTRQMLVWVGLTLLLSATYYLLSKRMAVVVHDKIRINGEARFI